MDPVDREEKQIHQTYNQKNESLLWCWPLFWESRRLNHQKPSVTNTEIIVILKSMLYWTTNLGF